MTSFQRLLRGLQVLNRYSGVTDVVMFGPTGVSNEAIAIPVPATYKLDTRDIETLLKLDWQYEEQDSVWVFEP